MQLKLTTDYAIRTVVYLATQSGITSVAEIGSKMGISENYLMKVLKALKDAGLVAGYQGKRGGYAISKHAPVEKDRGKNYRIYICGELL